MILLTGCNSFLGGKLLDALTRKGEKVRCYDFFKPSGFPEGIEFIQGDLLNERQLKKALSGVSVVLHFMEMKYPDSRGRAFMKKVNIRGCANILQSSHEAGVKKFFFLSRFAVYGRNRAALIREDDRKKPLTPYARDKLRAESLCPDYIKKNMPVTIFRPAPILGPGIKEPAVLTSLFMALGMEEANRVYLSKNGHTRHQLLHVDDAVRAILKALKSDLSPGRIYNIGSDNVPTKLDEIVLAKEQLKINPEIIFIQPWKAHLYSLLLGEARSHMFTRDHIMYLLHSMVMDCQSIKDDLDWQPEKDNIRILTETARWYMDEKL
jgi:nucleoside-diphosphate-sugar epimerase